MSEEAKLAAEAEARTAGYAPENVQVLRDALHIRKRPGMYIGDTGSQGLHHLVFELINNSVDEASVGFCKNIHVKIHADGSISVSDDGRGIPVDIDIEEKTSMLELAMTRVGMGHKFHKRGYKTATGLHGVGVKIVIALAEWAEVEVRRDGKVYVQEYLRGKAVTAVSEVGMTPGNRTGTRVTFKPDREIFQDATFEYQVLENRLRELAFLNKGLNFKLTDERIGKEETFVYARGVAEYVEYLNGTNEAIHKLFYVDKTIDEVRVEVAFQYTSDNEERILSYANNARTLHGGSHLSGFRSALSNTLGFFGIHQHCFNEALPSDESLCMGITAVVIVEVCEPMYEGSTKAKLYNPEVKGIVSTVLHEHLTTFLNENPKEALRIMKKIALAGKPAGL